MSSDDWPARFTKEALEQVDAVDRKFAARGDLLKGLGSAPGQGSWPKESVSRSEAVKKST